MTREAIIEQLQEVIDKHRKEAHITCPDTCWCWDVQNIILAIELSLPPAEGAEADGMMFTISEDGINPLDEQPTAEGAEEILTNLETYYDFKFHWIEKDRIVRAMHEFATLHAQKIADKMVEDMRKKLFSMRATKEAMDKLDADDKLMQYGYHDCINEMLMWTKSRER